MTATATATVWQLVPQVTACPLVRLLGRKPWRAVATTVLKACPLVRLVGRKLWRAVVAMATVMACQPVSQVQHVVATTAVLKARPLVVACATEPGLQRGLQPVETCHLLHRHRRRRHHQNPRAQRGAASASPLQSWVQAHLAPPQLRHRPAMRAPRRHLSQHPSRLDSVPDQIRVCVTRTSADAASVHAMSLCSIPASTLEPPPLQYRQEVTAILPPHLPLLHAGRRQDRRRSSPRA